MAGIILNPLILPFFLFILCPSQCLNISTNLSDIKFYLYPKQGNPRYRQELKLNNDASLARSSFKPNSLLVIMVHGYTNNASTPHFKVIKDSYVNSTFRANYVIMDWGPLAGQSVTPLEFFPLYPFAVRNIPGVGATLARFIVWLHDSGVIDPFRVHLIGQSLGAHVVGQGGREVIKAMGGFKLSRITGLDPAGPLFWPPDTSRNINKEDANFVDIIHTNAFEYGEKTTEGHVDFIVNDGTNQPGCGIESHIITSCSHTFSEKLYAATFHESYFGCQCSHWELDPMSFQQCLKTCPNPVRVGLYTPHDARGVFTVITGKL